ncbi:hypothetical protein F3Y22_tig00110429pilonHSYRG01424 [Hibiscus syriacus]|uniref:RNase H type-1 domain-containing protein n=1 Tax=Hibiscus syriacus TaxID=106335 RepID=A0A6A3ARC4_HIBSY|nr:hypothetical protein F3Y22_tig00110429pilonHSYRG01424 [Hibiscus syriacus]
MGRSGGPNVTSRIGSGYPYRYVGVTSVVSRLSSTDPDFSEIGAFIWEARQRSKAFSTCAFRFTPRNSNRAAHLLAAGDGMG